MSTEIVENALNEVLDIVQRQKRAQITRANKKKLEISRRVARGKMASQKNLKKRAYAQARKIVRRKFAGKRGEEYETLGPAEKMVIDKAVEGKVKLIKKIAARLLPRIQQAESKRLSSFIKGKQLQNLGANERKTMNEEVNKKFGDKFKGQKSKKVAPQIKMYNKFSEEVLSESGIYKSLIKKADKSEIDIEILGEVFDRGLEAWTEDQRVSREQYAFARVNSYINQGKSYFNEDADLHETYKPSSFDRTPPKVGSEHKIDHKGLNKKDTHKVTASEDGHVYFTNTRTKEIYNTNVRHFNFIRRPLKEELEEGKNTPSVKKIKGLSGQDTWKAMNKHGKTQFFNNPVSAHRHAGIPYEVKENLNEEKNPAHEELSHLKKHLGFVHVGLKHFYDKEHAELEPKAGHTLKTQKDKINHIHKALKKAGYTQHGESRVSSHGTHHSYWSSNKHNEVHVHVPKEENPKEVGVTAVHYMNYKHDHGHKPDVHANLSDAGHEDGRKIYNRELGHHAIKEELGPENEIGTDAVVRKYRKGTPGQENAETHENKKPEFKAEGPTSVKEEINVSTASADKKVVKVTGPDGQSHWRKIRRKEDLIKDQ